MRTFSLGSKKEAFGESEMLCMESAFSLKGDLNFEYEAEVSIEVSINVNGALRSGSVNTEAIQVVELSGELEDKTHAGQLDGVDTIF